MKAGAQLRDHFVRQETGGTASLFRRDAVRNPVQKRSREHVAGTRQIFRFAWKRRDVRLNAAVTNVGAVGAMCHHH